MNKKIFIFLFVFFTVIALSGNMVFVRSSVDWSVYEGEDLETGKKVVMLKTKAQDYESDFSITPELNVVINYGTRKVEIFIDFNPWFERGTLEDNYQRVEYKFDNQNWTVNSTSWKKEINKVVDLLISYVYLFKGKIDLVDSSKVLYFIDSFKKYSWFYIKFAFKEKNYIAKFSLRGFSGAISGYEKDFLKWYK